MWYLALACDYDGTLATHGAVLPDTVKALEKLLDSGRKLVLVTGRVLPELQSVCPHLSLFERVVAENGALIYRPATHEERALAEPPPEAFVAELRHRGVGPIAVGRAIVATWTPHETTVLETIRDLGLELQVIFNKGAVMILPTGVNKATGLAVALDEICLSPHNVVAIGDAENDHALLASCEVGAAVANATETLKEHADVVTEADHGAGVTELIEKLVADDLQELEPRLGRHSILLGSTLADDREIRLPPYRMNVLITGISGGGKSTVATAIVERLIEAGYQTCVIDPEGDYQELPGATVFGDSKQAPSADAVVQLMEHPDRNAIVNLLGAPIQDRPSFFLGLLPRLHELRARTGHPHWIMVDEAHHVLPSAWTPATLALPQRIDRMLFVTLSPDLLPAAVLELIDAVIAVGDEAEKMLKTFADATNAKAPKSLGAALEQGQLAYWLPHESRRPEIVKLAPGKTVQHRHRRKYAEGELEPERSFYFRGPEEKLNLRAQNLMTFMQLADGIDDESWQHHLRRGDYSAWFRDGIKDPELADEAARVEQDNFAAPDSSRSRIRELIETRYTLPASPATPVSSRMASSTERSKSPESAG